MRQENPNAALISIAARPDRVLSVYSVLVSLSMAKSHFFSKEGVCMGAKTASTRVSSRALQQVTFPDGSSVPPIGMGTWHMGEDPSKRAGEVKALKAGFESGSRLIDTAEMYGNGAAESVVGKALRELPREQVFLVSKVLPENAGCDRIFDACRASLKRLGTSYLDLYLLHWRGPVPLIETVGCMEQLKEHGLIRRWGVSNFDVDDMQDLVSVPGGIDCATDQVLYHLASRGVEHDLLPWLHARHMPLMAYCPLAQAGRLSRGILQDEAVASIAAAHGATPAQVILAFAIRSGWVIALPKAGTADHARENAAAMSLALTTDELSTLSQRYPAPHCKVPLDVQ